MHELYMDSEMYRDRIKELEEEIVSTVCSQGLPYPDHVIPRKEFEKIAEKNGY